MLRSERRMLSVLRCISSTSLRHHTLRCTQNAVTTQALAALTYGSHKCVHTAATSCNAAQMSATSKPRRS